MKNINIKFECGFDEINSEELKNYENEVLEARKTLLDKTGLGKEYTGWVYYPLEIQEKEIDDIISAAKEIKSQSQCLVVIGIGGSYLGAKAALDLLQSYYPDNSFEIIFLGNNISPEYYIETLKYLETVDFSVNVISKSGKTLEPSIAFRFVRELLIEKYGDEYSKRVYVTTSSANSILHDLAVKEKYKEFYIPDNIGGRYSVFTAVGLLPICCAGFDVYEIIKGAINSCQEYTTAPYNDNACLQYASIRNILYKKGKLIEILASYEPKMKNFGEWWKQLFGESEGKNGKGIFPVSVSYSTDLHSLGQYVQDGVRNIFETVINFNSVKNETKVKKEADNADGLNYLAGKSLNFIKEQIIKGVVDAHVQGKVPNIILTMDEISEYNFGYLAYFFMFACGVSGYLLDVNPFDQEGVEAYKKNVSVLLKK